MVIFQRSRLVVAVCFFALHQERPRHCVSSGSFLLCPQSLVKIRQSVRSTDAAAFFYLWKDLKIIGWAARLYRGYGRIGACVKQFSRLPGVMKTGALKEQALGLWLVRPSTRGQTGPGGAVAIRISDTLFYQCVTQSLAAGGEETSRLQPSLCLVPLLTHDLCRY